MDKKEILLQTALKLFVSRGFNDTPTSKIAKEAGIATGTLFYFFPTKDDLIVSLYLRLKDLAAENINAVLSGAKSIKEMIKTYYEESLKWSLHNPNEFLFLAQFSNSTYLKKIGHNEISAHIAPVLKIFHSAIAEKLIIDIDVNLLYILISNQVFGVNQYLVSKKTSKKAQRKIIEDTFDLFWKMIQNTEEHKEFKQ